MSNISLYWFQKEAIKRVEESWSKGNRSVLISVPTGGGKCVGGETLAYTNNGICEIKKLAKGIPSNMAMYRRGLAVDSRTGAKDCSCVYRSTFSSVLKIRTKLGYELSGTLEHPALFQEKDVSLVMKRLDEVNKGDAAVLKKGCNLWAPFPPRRTGSSLGAALNISFILDRLGKDIHDLAGILCNSASIEDVLVKHNTASVFIESLDEIPSVILNGGKEVAAIFLSCLFSQNQPSDSISFDTPREKLSKQAQTLLLALGVPSKREAKLNGKIYYSISIEDPYISSFMRFIGFTDKTDKKAVRYFNKLARNSPVQKDANKYLFDPVVSITRAVEDVYDLTIPDGHEFVANGFVVHNTIIFSSILKNMLDNEAVRRRNRGVVLVHRDTLLTQAEEKLNFVWPGVQTGRVQGGIYDYDKQVTVASVPTLTGRLDEFKASCEQYGPPGIVIYDEAHHAYASTWKTITRFFKENYDPLMLGVTATPIRTNKKESLSEIFEDVPYSISIFQLIQEGFLSPLVGYSVNTDLNLEGVSIRHGDYNAKELSDRIRHSDFNRRVTQVWAERAKNRKAICFAVDIEHVETLTEEFKRLGARAAGIHGKLPREEQRQILKEFSEGKYNVLINCMILTEGFDEPSVDCVLMARPTSSRGLYVQVIGRGLRLSPGKKDCLLIDFTGNSEKHTMITMQDLLGFYGLNKAEKLYKDRETAAGNGLDELYGEEPFIISPDTIPTITAVDKFGEEFETSIASREIDVFDINRFAWNTIGGNQFVTVRKNLSIAICESENAFADGRKKFTPYLVYSTKFDKWISCLSGPVDKEFALAIANVQLFDYGDRKLALKNAPWRNEECTPSQKQVLDAAIVKYNNCNPNKLISLTEIPSTRGDYSSMITSLFTLGYIKSNIKRISKDEATELLKKNVISEISASDTNNDNTNPAGGAEILHNELNITGNCSDSDRQLLIDVMVALRNIKYGDFPLKFIASNPIEFVGNTVKVYRRVYPRYPLSDKQKAFLMDKIGLVFRLHFRNKNLEIVNLNTAKGERHALRANCKQHT